MESKPPSPCSLNLRGRHDLSNFLEHTTPSFIKPPRTFPSIKPPRTARQSNLHDTTIYVTSSADRGRFLVPSYPSTFLDITTYGMEPPRQTEVDSSYLAIHQTSSTSRPMELPCTSHPSNFPGRQRALLFKKSWPVVTSINVPGAICTQGNSLLDLGPSHKEGYADPPPPPLWSGYLYIKDAECAESNEKSWFKFFRF